MRVEDYKHSFKFDSELEVVFPKEIFEPVIKKDDIEESEDFENMLSNINKQVTEIDINVNNFVKNKSEIEKKAQAIELERAALEDAKFAFEQQMKLETQKLEDLKIDFEQEKTKVFNEIEAERECLEKEKNSFEKHRSEQLMLIEQNKKLLTKNYKQFEDIVTNFNEKMDKFNVEN